MIILIEYDYFNRIYKYEIHVKITYILEKFIDGLRENYIIFSFEIFDKIKLENHY
jgi:hypothetical protein